MTTTFGPVLYGLVTPEATSADLTAFQGLGGPDYRGRGPRPGEGESVTTSGCHQNGESEGGR